MRKVEVISIEEKEKENSIATLHSTPSERIITMFRLMELSYYLGNQNKIVISSLDQSNVIELKFANESK